MDRDMKRFRYDVCGEGVFDENTGEFLAGMVALKDVTEYTEIIKIQSEENERQFEMICHTMPQMVGGLTASYSYFTDQFSAIALDDMSNGLVRLVKISTQICQVSQANFGRLVLPAVV